MDILKAVLSVLVSEVTTVSIPKRFYRKLRSLAKAQGVSVEDYVLGLIA